MRHVLDDLGLLHHSYRLFGVENRQVERFQINQVCKGSTLLGYMMLAIGKARRHYSGRPSFAELFCADGCFTMTANYFGAAPAAGIDNASDGRSNHAPEGRTSWRISAASTTSAILWRFFVSRTSLRDAFSSCKPSCRCRAMSFMKLVASQGYRITDAHFNQLEGNPRPEDPGSVYVLIEKT
jgi:hypothetical protein